MIVPVHNRAALLRRSLGSVANQKFPAGFEVVVADDNSTDDSAAVAEELATTVVRHQHNQGPGAARNSAIDASRGEWIAFLDSDDVWHPLHLQSLWDHRHGVALVGSSGLAQSGTGSRVEGSPFLRNVEVRKPSDLLRPRNLIKTSACMVQASVLHAVGGFTPGMRYSEDLDLWLRILEGHRGRILSVLTVVTSPHDGQMTLASSAAMRESTRAVVQSDLGVRCLSTRARAQAVTTMDWDGFRASGGHNLQALRPFATPTRAWTVSELMWRKFEQQHRWRFQQQRTSELRQLLAP